MRPSPSSIRQQLLSATAFPGATSYASFGGPITLVVHTEAGPKEEVVGQTVATAVFVSDDVKEGAVKKGNSDNVQ